MISTELFLEFKRHCYRNKKKFKNTQSNIEFFNDNSELLINSFKIEKGGLFTTKYKQELLESLLFDDFINIIKSDINLCHLKKYFKEGFNSVAFFSKQIKLKNDTSYNVFVNLKEERIILEQYISLPHGHHRHKDTYGKWIQKFNNFDFFGTDTISENLDVNYDNIRKILELINHNMNKKYELRKDKIQELLQNSTNDLLTIYDISESIRNKNNKIQIFNKNSLIIAYMLNKIQNKFKNNSFISTFDEEDSFLINISSKFKENGQPLYYNMQGQKYDNILIKNIFDDYYINITIENLKIKITFDSRNRDGKFEDIKYLDLNDDNLNNIDEFIFKHIKNICKDKKSEAIFKEYYNSIIESLKIEINRVDYEFITPSFELINYNRIIKQNFPIIIKNKGEIFYEKNIDFKKINIDEIKISIEKAFLLSSLRKDNFNNINKKRI